MLFGGRPSSFPHLSAYLEEQKRRKRTQGGEFPWIGAGMILVIAGLLMGEKIPVLYWSSVGLIAAACGWFLYRFRHELVGANTAQKRRPREAEAVIKLLRMGMNNRRLHRDLGESSSILLDEAARQWCRVDSILKSTIWESDDLPAHYKTIRGQARVAADASMEEILILYRPYLLDSGNRRKVIDIVGEVMENLTKQKVNEPPVQVLEPARRIVESMAELSDRLDRQTAKVAADPLLRGSVGAEVAIRSVLGDLKNLEIAEQELQQSVGQPPNFEG